MTEPESHTLAYLPRLDEKLDRQHAETGARLDRVEGRLGRIEDELLVLNGIALRLEGREVETTGLKAILDRHEHGLADLGRRIAELEGAQKDSARGPERTRHPLSPLGSLKGVATREWPSRHGWRVLGTRERNRAICRDRDP